MDYRSAQIAEIYDLINPWAKDSDFYLSLAGPRPCSVLDLGCGTGTLCCALAERGHRVTGVDPAAAMLAVARRKAHAEQVEWVESSAQSYKSQRRFDLVVMTGHAFQILLTAPMPWPCWRRCVAISRRRAARLRLRLAIRAWIGLASGRSGRL